MIDSGHDNRIDDALPSYAGHRLIVRPPHAPAAAAGETVEVLLFPPGPARF